MKLLHQLLSFFGHLHPLLVHFPVSLLVLAALLHLFTKKKEAVQLLVLVGGLAALLSTFTGLVLINTESMEGEAILQHRNAGIALSLCSIVLLYFLYKKKTESFYFSWLLAGTGLITTLTGHLGANLTHGEDYLFGSFSKATLSDASYGDVLTEADQVRLLTDVRTILAHNCYQCHSATKIKGELRLDSKEFVFKGGENGSVIEPGNADASELYRRITLPVDHKESMPSKGKKLSEQEIQILATWINAGAPWPEGVELKSVFPKAELAPRRPEIPAGDFENPIDLFVNAYFKENMVDWKKKVDDRTFLKRVYLDVIGLQPNYAEILAFEKDKNPQKRELKIEELLQDKHAYTQHWLTFWNDILRNDYTGTGYITKGRFNSNTWLYSSLLHNKPYDQLVAELLNPTEESKGFISGIKWRGTVNASQTTEMQAAQNVGQVLLGVNVKCASCHDSFVSDWKLDEAYAFANVFSDEPLEIAHCEKPTGKMAGTGFLWPELGKIDSSWKREEKLQALAQYVVKPENGRLYRTLVNRIWAQLMGRGIVGTVDEMDNAPWSADLLDWLAVNFVDNEKDIKKLLFLILSSEIYQMESNAIENPDKLYKEDYVFKGMLTRKLTAEQFTDIVSQRIFPVYSKENLGFKALENAGFELVQTLAPRASLIKNDAFLTALGRPNREIVATTRPLEASLLQALELTNGERLDNTLKKGAKQLVQRYPNTRHLIVLVYQNVLGRNPLTEELQLAEKVLGDTPIVENVQDFLWSLLMLPEFQIIS